MGRRSTTGGVGESRGKIQLTVNWCGKRLRPTLDLEWNERNRRAALRLVEEIRAKIRHGTFNPADYFPEYAGLTLLGAAHQAPRTFGYYAALWLASLTDLAPATRQDYRKILDRVWLPALAERPISDIRYSDVVAAFAAVKAGGKTRNNNLIPVRQVFAFAMKDGAIDVNPAAKIENAKVQKPRPDPFSAVEVATILADLATYEHPQIANYFTVAFNCGLRPSEQIALRWSDIDFNSRTVRVQRARVRGIDKACTKTHEIRDVDLNEAAWAAIMSQREYTQLQNGAIFHRPPVAREWQDGPTPCMNGARRRAAYYARTDVAHRAIAHLSQPWKDEKAQHQYWDRCLRRAKIRYRVPYQCRHTYATQALMLGASPLYVSAQLGHANTQMLHRVYSKWINGADMGRERAKLNAGFASDLPAKTPISAKKLYKSMGFWRRERDSNPRYTFGRMLP
jgi:integrase